MSIHLRLVVPNRAVFDGAVEYAVIPATEGLMGVMPGHAPFLGLLLQGQVTVRHNGVDERFPVSGGIFQVLPDRVIILAEDATAAPTQAT